MTPIYNRELMTTLKCGCNNTGNNLDFEKEVKNGRGLIEEIHRMSYYHKRYINICGECEKKASIFNDMEKKKIDIEKEQFKIICKEPEIDEGMSFEEMVEAGILLPNGVS